MVDGSLDNVAAQGAPAPAPAPAPTREDDAPPTTTTSVVTIPAPDLAPTITPEAQLPQALLDAARGKADPPERAAYAFGRAELKGAVLVALYEQGTVTNAARKVGISRMTVHTWRQDDPAFDAALADGMEACTDRVEAALFRDALGGDTVAKIFYLKGRRPREWHDKARLEVSGPGGGPVPVTVAPAEAAELRETARQLREGKGSTEASE